MCEIREGVDHVISPMINNSKILDILPRCKLLSRDGNRKVQRVFFVVYLSELCSTLKGQDRVRFGGASSGVVL